MTQWHQTNANTDIKPSHRGSYCDTQNLQEKQKVSSEIQEFSIRKRETIRWSGPQTLFAEPFLQTKFQVESQDMKNKEVKVMMKLEKMSVKVLLAWISLFCLSLPWRGSMYFQLAVSYWKWIRKLTQRNGICMSSPSNFQHVLIGLCSVAVSHLFCPLFSCYEILATYWKKVVFNIYSSNFIKC